MDKKLFQWTPKFKLKWSYDFKNLLIEMIELPQCIPNCGSFLINIIAWNYKNGHYYFIIKTDNKITNLYC